MGDPTTEGLSPYELRELQTIQKSVDPKFVQEWQEKLGRMPDWMIPPTTAAMPTRIATRRISPTEANMAYDDYSADMGATSEGTSLIAGNGTWDATTDWLKAVGKNSTISSPEAKVGQNVAVSMEAFTLLGGAIIGNYSNI